jgi:hypothetical protein
MSIPTLAIPEYTVKLFSLPKPTKFRPYLVGEEKILLMAQAGEDEKEIKAAVMQVLRTCTFDVVNIDKLPTFDLEYLYLQLRSKSVNNIVSVNYRCRNSVPVTTTPSGFKVCDTLVPVQVDLDTIQLEVSPDHTNKVWLNDKVGITLRYPTKEVVESVQSENGVFGIDLLTRCLETIFTKSGEVHEVAETDTKELEKFVSSISVSQFQKIQQFFDTMPKLTYNTEFKCPVCKYEQKLVITGLMDFFV